MSDGGGESARDGERNNTGKKLRIDDFTNAIARIAVAQVCESTGFQSFQQSALDSLSDVAVRYVIEIGKIAKSNAYLAGRTDCNVFDIIQGLEDLGSILGFAGASDINHCLAGSGTAGDIAHYIGKSEEIPFAYSIPGFPVIKERKPTPSFEQVGKTPPSEHIPPWLPVFPDPESWVHIPSENERVENIQMDKADQVKAHRKVERSLLNYEQRLTSNGTEAQVSVDTAETAKVKRAADSNPFLATPVQFGEKEVSTVILPAKLSDEAMVQNLAVENHVSILKTFAPAIEAVKSRLCESEEGRKRVLLDSRQSVQFKFGIHKKFLGTTVSLRNEDSEKTASWFGNDNGKDDKKRRAEQILKESTENTLELSQL